MAKKIDEAEVKKECPSCGLGVSLDSTICEFCGWDFEEEDEWILQIEKLERDLMLEKQKFEPGTVNDKIESTLHSPALEMREAANPAAKLGPAETPKIPEPAPKRSAESKRTPPKPEPVPVDRPTAPKSVSQKPATASVPIPVQQEASSSKVRRVRVVKSAQSAAEPQEDMASSRKLVRKVKQKG